MAYKQRFMDGEWNALIEAPMLAGFAVTAADPGGLVGAFQESAAIVGVLREAAENDASLPGEVANAYLTSDGRQTAADGIRRLVNGKSPDEASSAAILGLSDIMAIVDGTAPEQSGAFKAFLIDIATRTANAAKEGGFLGFGCESVSSAEQAALDELKTALGA